MRHLCSWLALLAGFALTLNAVPGRAADKADEATINKWIGKLSSGRFAEREKAQKELDKIGLPALDALRKAADKGDPETRRRAGELIARMEKHALAAKVLAPKKLRLTFKDTPVREAVADFAKKSGYNISLHDPQNKLKDRKITLDTGATTFWQAFDQFCAKAGLTEASQQDLMQAVPVPVLPPGGIRPPRGILPVNPPARPAPLPPLRIQPVQPPQKLAPPPQKQVLGQQARVQFVVALKDEVKPAQAPAIKGKPAAVPAQIQVQPAPAIQILPAQRIQIQPGVVWRGGRPIRRWPMIQPDQIILKDGKEKALPTAYSGAVRIRVLGDSARILGAAPSGEVLLGLQVSLEPKIRWQQLLAVHIDKAVDDQGQTLMPGMGGTPGAPPVGGVGFGGGVGGFAPQPMIWNPGFGGNGGVHQIVPVRLKKGEKAAKALKELSGTITAAVLAEPETLITADNILKAAGKTFKGTDGGSIKVNAVEENNGQLRLRVELVQPANAVPANQGFGGFGGFGGPGGGPMILPIAPAPVPLPPAKPLLPRGAFQLQGKAVQVQAVPAQVQIQVQIGGGGAVQIGGPAFFGGGNAGGLVLLDDKGTVIPTTGSGMMGRGGPGGITWEQQLTFQLRKGQKPARLVFKGSKRVNVEIPFSFNNVPLP